MNLCSGCGQDFRTVTAFDEHRVGYHAFTFTEGLLMEPPREDGRRCMDVSEMAEYGWTQDAKGRWQYPGDWAKQSWRWELEPA